MAKTLAWFWVRRFLMIFVLGCLGLGVFEILGKGMTSADFVSVIFWSALAALLTASIATWWAYRRHCKAAFKSGHR